MRLVYCLNEGHLFVCPFSHRSISHYITAGDRVERCPNSSSHCAVLSRPKSLPFSLIFPISLRVRNPLILNGKPSLSHIFMYLFALFVTLFQI